jgi:hypothetical protein
MSQPRQVWYLRALPREFLTVRIRLPKRPIIGGMKHATCFGWRMVTCERPKDLRSLDRGDLGCNPRGIRHGLRARRGRGAAAALHPACSCRSLCSLARTGHASDPMGRNGELAQAQTTWLVDSCRVRVIFLILIAMGAWDLWRRWRIHPTVLFGAALLWTGEIVTTMLNFSPTWRDLMARLVIAWGYAG